MVAFLHFILVFSLQLPIGFVDEDQTTRTSATFVRVFRDSWWQDLHGVIQHKQLLSWVLHDVVAKVPHKERDVCRLTRFIFGWQREVVLLLVGEENLEPTTVKSQQMPKHKDTIYAYLNSIVIEMASLSDMSDTNYLQGKNGDCKMLVV